MQWNIKCCSVLLHGTIEPWCHMRSMVYIFYIMWPFIIQSNDKDLHRCYIESFNFFLIRDYSGSQSLCVFYANHVITFNIFPCILYSYFFQKGYINFKCTIVTKACTVQNNHSVKMLNFKIFIFHCSQNFDIWQLIWS